MISGVEAGSLNPLVGGTFDHAANELRLTNADGSDTVLNMSGITGAAQPTLLVEDGKLYVEVLGKRLWVQAMAQKDGAADISDMDLRSAKISTGTKIDVRTWKALALMGCVEGYEEEKARSK